MAHVDGGIAKLVDSLISGGLDTRDSVFFDDKRRVLDLMITTIAATSDSLSITWKI